MKTLEDYLAMSRAELFVLRDTLRGLLENFTHDCVEAGMDGLKMLAYEKRLRAQLKLIQQAISRKFRKPKPKPLVAPELELAGKLRISIPEARRAVHSVPTHFRPHNQEYAEVPR